MSDGLSVKTWERLAVLSASVAFATAVYAGSALYLFSDIDVSEIGNGNELHEVNLNETAFPK